MNSPCAQSLNETRWVPEVLHEAQCYRHRRLKSARGAVQIHALETWPTHPVFARKTRCPLSHFKFRLPSSFPWTPESQMPASTSDDDESRGTEGIHKQHQTERRNSCYSDTLCFSTVSEIGILVTHSPGAHPAHSINKYANKAVLRAWHADGGGREGGKAVPRSSSLKDFNLMERFSIASLYFCGTPATRHTPFIHPLCFSPGQQPQPPAHSTFWALKEGYFRH